ncbi:MAG: hypothetical protein H6553_08210 [Chitinophagales bacterium]|nr:hypothetical protein [Chitinophagales bacterium]
MLSHDLVKIETYLNAYQAQIAKSKLDANNIYCYLKDEEIVQQDWLRTIAYGGVKLYVRKEDETIAKTILEQESIEEYLDYKSDEEQATDFPIYEGKPCIYCGSTNTRKQKFNKSAMAVGIFLLGLPFLFPSKKHYCFSCNEEFILE